MAELLQNRTDVPPGNWRWMPPPIDLGKTEGKCDWCGTRIRFVHRMRHPDWPEVIEVGCDCIKKISADWERAKVADDEMRKLAAKEARWLERPWRRARAGHWWLLVDRFTLRDASRENEFRIHVMVGQNRGGRWWVKVGNKFQSGSYPDKSSAMLAAFAQLVGD